MATFAILSCSTALAQAPTVVTDTRFARGSNQAFGRATFTAASGNSISKRGFCFSTTHSEPTIDDQLSTGTLSNNGLIYWMKDLEPSTRYYARAYAVAKDGSVGYGNVIKIVTLPKGTITWGYDNGGSEDQNSRINAAVGSCVNYWNNLTSIDGLYLNVHYGSETPTADCSYGGWMRVGPNSSYQKTGTIMHEALHAIGVGTCGLWYDGSSPLRAGSGTGQWLGERATELVQFWDNNKTSTLNGDGTHLWPYGINGAHEDTGSEVLYIGNSLIAQAVCEDGLPPTSGRPAGLPYYSFDQEDTLRYYIKNESESYGLMTSYLTMSADGSLGWEKLSAQEATASDKAAWCITFNPTTQYYSIKNIATGKYITLNGTQNLQLMRSRKEVTNTAGAVVCSQRGYWFVQGGSSTCLSASNNGATTTAGLNLADNQQRQRWIILTSKQASDMEDTGLTATRSAFKNKYNEIIPLCDVPHREVSEGADDLFNSTLSQLSAECDQAASTGEVQTLIDKMNTAVRNWLANVCVTSADTLFDLSFLISNPGFTNGVTGWAGTITSYATVSNNEVEFYQKSATATQILSKMPLGTYHVKCQGFQRPGSYTTVYNDYTAGKDNVNARLYAGKASTGFVMFKNLMAERATSQLHTGDKKMSDGTYVPDNMASAEAHFKAGFYWNTSEYYHSATGDLTIGIHSTGNTSSSYWFCFTNFRLLSYGNIKAEQLVSLEELPVQPTSDSRVYNINGTRVDAQTRGITVRNGRITFVK